MIKPAQTTSRELGQALTPALVALVRLLARQAAQEDCRVAKPLEPTALSGDHPERPAHPDTVAELSHSPHKRRPG